MEDLREPGPEDVVAAAEASYALLSPPALTWTGPSPPAISSGTAARPWSTYPSSSCFYATHAADPSQRRLSNRPHQQSGPVYRRVGPESTSH